MNKLVSALFAATMLAGAPALAEVKVTINAPRAAIGSFGFDAGGMDRSVPPGNDFYGFANGNWAKETKIPDDKSNYGAFSTLADLSEQRVHAILEAAKTDPNSKIGVAYATFMDGGAIEAKGLAPLKPWLERIAKLKDKKAYAALAAEADRNGVPNVIGAYVGQDDKNPDAYILIFYQSGLGMPDRDYYLSDDAKMVETRKAYAAHIETMLTLAGEKNAAARAAALLAFETGIAQAHWTKVDSRDATKTYNKKSLAEFQALMPGFDVAAYVGGIGAKGQTHVLVSQPSAFEGIAKAVAAADLGVLKDQLLVRSLDSFSDVLPKAFVDQNFAFYEKTLSGTPMLRDRWKRGVSFVEDALGHELGKAYVAQHFPPETKAKMDLLVKNVIAAMGRRIDQLAWMTPETKVKARAKLAAFTTKIGYPDKWRSYDGLDIAAGDAFGNALRSNRFEHDYRIDKLGKPIDRDEWHMLPQTVNAYANFGMNEIVFPAAILQPPFFDPNADDAINYGGIGAVIGHEISHHFDDQGSKYDQTGKLSDWWTAQDVENFNKLTGKLVTQYDAYEPLPGAKVQGQFTLGENIGDLAGLAVAYDAWQASLGGKPAPVVDGFSGDQRFWLGWAQVWRRNYRENNLRQRLLTDPHSPSQQRAWVVRNFDNWYSAFNVKPGEALYLAPEDRVRIW